MDTGALVMATAEVRENILSEHVWSMYEVLAVYTLTSITT